MIRKSSLAVAVGLTAVLSLGGAAAYAQVPQNSVTLTGAKEAPAKGDPNGRGQFSWSLDGSRLCYLITSKRIGTPVAAHIHKGKAGISGPVKVTLSPPAPNAMAACVTVGSTLASNLRARPSSFYVNIHTAAYPAGALRAQL